MPFTVRVCHPTSSKSSRNGVNDCFGRSLLVPRTFFSQPFRSHLTFLLVSQASFFSWAPLSWASLSQLVVHIWLALLMFCDIALQVSDLDEFLNLIFQCQTLSYCGRNCNDSGSFCSYQHWEGRGTYKVSESTLCSVLLPR